LKNVLITGVSGYVGKALVSELKNINLFSLDRIYDKDISRQSDKFICNDLNKLSLETESFLFDFSGTIVHLAAARSDDFSEKTYVIDTLRATETFIAKLDPKKIKLFIHIGSVAAIDGQVLEQKGITITCSDDWYRLSKYQQQKIIESWAIKNNIPLVILAPSAIYDSDASKNSTNIGRLEKVVNFLKVVPEINVLKSLTSMTEFVSTIRYFIDENTQTSNQQSMELIQRYLVLDNPVMTVTDICKKKFKAKLVIKIPKLQVLLLFFAGLIRLIGLERKIPLSKERVIKLYKPTDYKDVVGYKEWFNEDT
jgi:nucleoside-diphosphate-sugar epimerase